MELTPGGSSAGVLSDAWLNKAIEDRIITSDGEIPETNIQPSSLDLRLGDVAHRLRCSFLPDDEPVKKKLQRLEMGSFSLKDGAILERNRPYLIPLKERLDLPDHLRARANPKSSTGRLDIFTRVITNKGTRFDDIRPGYRGHLYLEVVPRSFTISVRSGLCLNQLRIMGAQTTTLSDSKIRALHETSPLLFRNGRGIAPSKVDVANGLFMSLDLSGDKGGVVGYRARRNSNVIDLTNTNHYEVDEFWDPVSKLDGDRIILDPEEFYLLLSAESVRIPPEYASEMTAYDPTSGELRTHYAGFFDPGFGHDDDTRLRGSRATLEVRAHDVPFMVEGRQKVCKLTFEPMLDLPLKLYGRDLGSNYQGQTVTLSKHFKVERPGVRNQPRLPFAG